MRTLALILALIVLPATAADPKLEATLEKVAKYDYDQGREPLLALENIMRSMPATDAEKRFIEFLKTDASIAGKDFICRQLSLIGSAAAVPTLARMLDSQETVEMARYALERIPGPASLEVLRNSLSKAPEKARPGIVNTLGLRRDTEAVPAIAKLVDSSNRDLSNSAIYALGKIASPQALSTLATLRKKGSLDAMEASLIAADHLAASGQRPQALTIYRELAASGTPAMMRIGGLQGLATTGGKEELKQIRSSVDDSDTKVQAAAIKALNKIDGPETTAAMIEALPKLGPAGRVRMVTALAHRGDRSALPAINKSTSDEALEVRVAALDGLSVIGDPAAVQMLAERASNAALEEVERNAARTSLDRMRGANVDSSIIAGISSAATPVRIELIRSAGERGIEKAAEVILLSVNDTNRTLRREAFRSLRETAGSAQVPALLDLLVASKAQSDRRELERALSSALRRSPAARSVDVVAAYKKAESTDVRASLLQVMGQAGTAEVLPVLRAATRDSNPDIVRAAILGLTEWPGDDPMRDLLALAGETENQAHRILALRGFLNLVQLPSDRPATDTVGLLRSAMKLADQADEKKAILGLLPRYPTPEALELAKAASTDAAVADEAKMAVQRLERSLRPR